MQRAFKRGVNVALRCYPAHLAVRRKNKIEVIEVRLLDSSGDVGYRDVVLRGRLEVSKLIPSGAGRILTFLHTA